MNIPMDMDEDDFDLVAQGCSRFRFEGHTGNRFGACGEDIACSSCERWDGHRCNSGNDESLLKRQN